MSFVSNTILYGGKFMKTEDAWKLVQIVGQSLPLSLYACIEQFKKGKPNPIERKHDSIGQQLVRWDSLQFGYANTKDTIRTQIGIGSSQVAFSELFAALLATMFVYDHPILIHKLTMCHKTEAEQQAAVSMVEKIFGPTKDNALSIQTDNRPICLQHLLGEPSIAISVLTKYPFRLNNPIKQMLLNQVCELRDLYHSSPTGVKSSISITRKESIPATIEIYDLDEYPP
jgi:hypothetical protein